MKLVLLVLITMVLGCTTVSYPKCATLHAQACIGSGISVCDGELWLPVVDCSEQTDSSGASLVMVCQMEDDGTAACSERTEK